MLDATESWLNYINLPREYPRTAELGRDLDDEIMAAIEDVMRRWKAKDALLCAMLDDRYAPWTWATVRACALPVGTTVRDGTWTGRIAPQGPLHPNHPADQPPHWASITWERTDEHVGRYGPRIRFDEHIEAYVPVPFDLGPLITEHGGVKPAPAVATKPKRTGAAVRLTPPQVELLTDIATKPAMYITSYTRWDQTATALCDKGLAAKRYVGGGQYELTITEPGRAEAVRRGIIPADTAEEKP